MMEAKTADTWPAWECQECRCKSYARIDEQIDERYFRPGPYVRCVNCKREWYLPEQSQQTHPTLQAIEARLRNAREMVHALCQHRSSPGAREWLMSIPARPDYDPDLVIDASLRDVRWLLSEHARLTARIAELEQEAVEMRSAVSYR